MKKVIDDKYISMNEYKKYCEEENITFDEKNLEEINNIFIDKKLIEYKDYFDNMFINVGENINLDEEQRRIILRDDDYCLVNAGAGSGKSTTMAAKVKYLVDKLNIKPEEIIMLTFTKKSSQDLDEKVNTLLDMGVTVSTFHSLGMKFVKRFYPYPIDVVGRDEQVTIISNYIKGLFKDKEKLKELIQIFKQFTHHGTTKNYIARGFIENYHKFDTFEEYFKDYKKRKFEKENSKEGGIHQYILNRLELSETLYTIRGEKVKSLGEVKIANFLYMNGIDYYYEKIYDEKVNEDTTYHPDFTIDYQGKTIYIEYFGLSRCYNGNNELIKKEKAKYNRIRRMKEKFQNQSKNEFINLDYKYPDANFLNELEKTLLDKNIQLNKRSDEEIFERILDNNLAAEFFHFVDLITEFIETFKMMLVDEGKEDYMFQKRIDEIKKEEFNYTCYSIDREKEQNCRIKGIKFLREIYNYYQKYLKENHMIDYEDMICLCYRYIIKEVKNKYSDLNYKYVIVDEYQDITFQRFLFVKKLIEYFDAKLISVGDDWQSIYAFTGSRLDLFNRFNEMFNNGKDDMFLSTTYRYGQELVDITSKFVLENNEQTVKKLKAIKNLKHPIEICRYRNFEEENEIYRIVHKIYKENPNDEILILARTNECLKKLQKGMHFQKGINDILICKDLPDAKIEAITMHRSKGLTSDQVIVFGLREKIFPSRGKKSHWIFEYFNLDYIKDEMPFAEERRLFYVALTRTRNKVYLVVPNGRLQTTEFVNEIERNM